MNSTLQYKHPTDPTVAFSVTLRPWTPTAESEVPNLTSIQVNDPHKAMRECRRQIAECWLMHCVERIDGLTVRDVGILAMARPGEMERLGSPQDLLPASRRDGTQMFEDNTIWLMSQSQEFFEFILDAISKI